jgi:hypothetical protein
MEIPSFARKYGLSFEKNEGFAIGKYFFKSRTDNNISLIFSPSRPHKSNGRNVLFSTRKAKALPLYTFPCNTDTSAKIYIPLAGGEDGERFQVRRPTVFPPFFRWATPKASPPCTGANTHPRKKQRGQVRVQPLDRNTLPPPHPPFR